MHISGHSSRRAALGLGVAAGLGTLFGCASKSDSDTGNTVTAKEAALTSAPAEPKVTNPDEALARLQAGVARFTSGNVNRPDQSIAFRTSLAKGQHPFATILSCVDSRVPPEIVFDQGLGDLFVSRTAGQVVDHAVLGSLQYGVAELKIPLLVVLGHEKCGAVKATVEAVEKKSAAMGNDIDTIVAAIKPAVQKAEEEKPSDLLDASVRANVANVVAALRKKPVLSSAVSAGALKIVGARYDLDADTVEFLT
jgi:carbonic anhydrase